MSGSELTTRNDLAWLASSYVLGELSADEAVAFETRLATDDAARDAVVRATELNLAIAAAMADQPVTASVQPVVVPPSRWSSAAAVSAFAATAIAAASVALMLGRGLTMNEMARKDGADRLVAAWARGEAARNNHTDDESLELADDADLDPPDWMLAALTVEVAKEQLPGNDEVREN